MRKLAIFTGGYAAAVFAAVLLFPELNRWAVGGACAGVAVLLVLLRRLLPDKPRRRALLCCAGLALGMLWTGGYERMFLAPVRELDDTTIVLTATVIDWPQKGDYDIKVRTRADLPQGGRTDVLLSMDALYADLRPGDVLTTVAHCSVSDKNGFGQQVGYNTAKGIFLAAKAYGEPEIIRAESVDLSTFPARTLRALQRGIEDVFPYRTQTLIRAIVTGDREQLEPIMVSGLKRTGLSHTVAVSGMHLAFLAGLLNLLLGRGRRRTAIMTIPVIVLFVFMIGCTPSVVRAAVMLIMLQIAPLLGREEDTPTSLLLALFLLLVQNPFAAADIGLQLSFGAVAGIALFTQRLQDRLCGWMIPEKGLKEVRNRAFRTVASVLAVTLSAQVFTVPLTALYFDTVSLISPVANLLCMWAVSALFVLGVIGGFLGVLVPAAAGVLGTLAAPVGECFHYIVTTLAKISFAAIPAGPELYRLWLVLVYLLIVLGMLLPGKKRLGLPCAVAVLTLLAAIFCTVTQLRTAPLKVDVLDVGQGQSVLMRVGDRFALVDCGGDSYHDPGDIAADRLQSHGSDTLDLLVISHYHDDHANGVPELLDRIDVRCIVLPDVQEDSDLRQEILTRAEQEGAKILFVREDTAIELGEATVTVYPPLGKTDANELGLTVLCSVLDYDVLITGDMDSGCERDLIDYAELPDVELMLAGHHGSKYSNSKQLLERVRPDVTVFSVGAYNRYGHPTPEAMERFAAVGADIYRTDTMGTVSLSVNPMKKGA